MRAGAGRGCGSRSADTAPRAAIRASQTWIGVSAVSLHETTQLFLHCQYVAGRLQRAFGRRRRCAAIEADSKQTHVAPQSSLTGVSADAGRLTGDGIFNSFRGSLSAGSPNRYA